MLSSMAGKRGSPKSEFPQIRVKKEVYDALRDLRFAFRKESLNEVIEELLKRRRKK
jgi:predicted CopG family antitoxin